MIVSGGHYWRPGGCDAMAGHHSANKRWLLPLRTVPLLFFYHLAYRWWQTLRLVWGLTPGDKIGRTALVGAPYIGKAIPIKYSRYVTRATYTATVCSEMMEVFVYNSLIYKTYSSLYWNLMHNCIFFLQNWMSMYLYLCDWQFTRMAPARDNCAAVLCSRVKERNNCYWRESGQVWTVVWLVAGKLWRIWI